MNVVDLGGTVSSWDLAPVRPARLVLVNAAVESTSTAGRAEFVEGDACALPDGLKAESFDLVYSNSVVEHVGGIFRMSQFADSVRSLAPHHWIQTPYRYFPIEPHFLFPGLQFLPLAARAKAIQRWPFSHSGSVDPADSVAVALGVELVGHTQFEFLFPDSEIIEERALGLTKSLIAVR